MFHEVRIYTPRGDLKKVISTQELSEAHWNTFNKIPLPDIKALILLREHKKQTIEADYHAGSNTNI